MEAINQKILEKEEEIKKIKSQQQDLIPPSESALSQAIKELEQLKKIYSLTVNEKNNANNRGEYDEADKLLQKINDLKKNAKNAEIQQLNNISINYSENANQFGKVSPNPQSQIQNEEDTVSFNIKNPPKQKPRERLYYDENANQFGKVSPNPQSQIQNEEDVMPKLFENPTPQPAKIQQQTPPVQNPMPNQTPATSTPQPTEQIQSAINPFEQLTDEEITALNNKISRIRHNFKGLGEIPADNLTEKEKNVFRQAGAYSNAPNEFSGEEEEWVQLDAFDKEVGRRKNSPQISTPQPVQIQQKIPPVKSADNVQSPKTESPKPKSTFAQDVLPAENTAVEGDKTKVVADNGKEYEVQYKVVESDNLIASHQLNPSDSNVYQNKNYPAGLQPRDRQRVSMQAELVSMSNNLRPADLMDSRNLNQGAPIVRNDGVVLNGNGRTAAIQFAYENGKAANYKQSIINNAEKFGLNRDAVSQMKNPVLVREITDELSDKDLQSVTESQTGGVRIGAGEQAKIDAGKITLQSLEFYVDNDEGDITTADNRDFLVSVLQDILNKNELNAYATASGNVNADGIRRVKRALFALAYDDDALIDKITESTDNDIKRITNALESAAPRIAQIKVKMKEGVLHNYDISDIASAAAKLSDIRKNKNLTVQEYLGQQALPNMPKESEIKKALVKFFDEHKNSAIYISDFLKGIADGIERQGNPNQVDLWDADEPSQAVPLMNLIDGAKKVAEEKLRERSEKAKPKQLNLFEEPEETPAVKDEKTPAQRIGEALKHSTPAPIQNEEEQVPPLDLRQPPSQTQTQEEQPKPNEKKHRIFLSQEERDREMYEAFGITPPQSTTVNDNVTKEEQSKPSEQKTSAPTETNNEEIEKFVDYFDDSDEHLEELKDRWNKRLKELGYRLNSIGGILFDSELWSAGLEIGGVYIQRGINNFANWAKQMTKTLGEESKPWQSAIWETLKTLPRDGKFNDRQMSAIAQQVGGLYEDGITDYAEIENYITEKINVEGIKPLIRATYDGIKTFFDENVNNQQGEENKKAEETKKSLIELAEKAWDDKNFNGKVSFQPSQKFRDKVQELFGHNVDTVFITADDVRHIKKHHGQLESQRGQLEITPETIAEIYDAVNDFDTATKERDDNLGNQSVMVVKGANGTSYVILVERGKSKAQVKTFYKLKRALQMSDANSPNFNVQNDSVKTLFENITQSEDEGKAETQENSYVELQRKAQRGENLTEDEKTILVKNLENLVVDEDLHDALYKKLPNIKHCIDIAFHADKLNISQGKETLTAFLVSDNNNEYAYAAQQLLELWRAERGLKLTDQAKLENKEKAFSELADRNWEDKISDKEFYGRTLKLLYDKSEKSHSKPPSEYEINLDNFKRYGTKSETRTTGDSKIIAKMSGDFKSITVTHTANGKSLTYQMPLKEIDKVIDDNDAFKNLVAKYFSQAYKKIAVENNIPAEQLQENTEALLERFGSYHENVVSDMHTHFRDEVPIEDNKAELNKNKNKTDNDDLPKLLTLPDGRKPYDVYKQTLDKQGQEFLEKEVPLGMFKMSRRTQVENAVQHKQPRESLQTEGERKYYDWLKEQLNENGYTIEERRSKGDTGRDEYTAIVKGDFKTDTGKKKLQYLKELAEKLGGELKKSSDKVASFYFGEKTKPLKQFQTTAKFLLNQKESAVEQSTTPKNEDESKTKSQGKTSAAENQGEREDTVTTYQKGEKKVEGISLVDGSTGSSPVTATGSLMRLADNKSGVSYHGANAMSNTPSLKNISQSAGEGQDRI